MPKVRLHRLLAFVYQGEGMLNLCGTKKAFKKLGDMSAFEVSPAGACLGLSLFLGGPVLFYDNSHAAPVALWVLCSPCSLSSKCNVKN